MEKLSRGEIATFLLSSKFLDNSIKVTLYLEKLQIQLERYVPENVWIGKYSWVRNPFFNSVHEFDDNTYVGFMKNFSITMLIKFIKKLLIKIQKRLPQFWAHIKEKPI